MEKNLSNIEDYMRQRNIRDYPEQIRDIIAQIYGEISEGMTDRKAQPDNSRIYTDGMNVIPSKFKGHCYPILIGICYDKDNFENRLFDCFNHASYSCLGINQEIYIISTQWISQIVNKFKGQINILRQNGVKIHMIYMTDTGIVEMPV